MSEAKKPEMLSEDDLDKVTGAGDPVPYPDVNTSGGNEVNVSGPLDGSTSSASGDEAGTTKNITSNTTAGKTQYKTGSSKVKVEGKDATRSIDLTSQ